MTTLHAGPSISVTERDGRLVVAFTGTWPQVRDLAFRFRETFPSHARGYSAVSREYSLPASLKARLIDWLDTAVAAHQVDWPQLFAVAKAEG